MRRILRGAIAGMAGVVWLGAACLGGGPSLPFGGLILELEPSNDMQAGSQVIPLDVSEAKMGILLMTTGDMDFFRVPLLSGETLTVGTMPLSSDAWTPFEDPDTQVAILNSSGTVLLESDNAGSDFPGALVRGSTVRFRALSNDLYAVRVRGTSPRFGIYMVMVSRAGGGSADVIEAEPNDTPGKALQLGLPYSGPLLGVFTLGTPADQDYFSLDLRVGESLMATTTPLQVAFSEPDTVMTVFDSNGTTVLVESDDDHGAENGGAVHGSTVRLRASHDGRYYIRVASYQASTAGVYAMTMSVAPRLSYCPADINGDGVVNSGDLALVLGNWGMCP